MGTKRDETAGDAGHADSPREDRTPSHPDARPATAPPAPGKVHADPPLPTSGRQPERPGQVGRHEEHLGDRDDETLKPSDRG